MYWCETFEFLLGVSWMCKMQFSSNLKKISAIVSSNTLSVLSPFSFWDSQYSYLGTFHDVSQLSEILFVFLLFFPFMFLQLTIQVDLLSGLPILSSTCSNLPVSPSNEVCISIILFDSRIPIWFFFYIFLLTYCIW